MSKVEAEEPIEVHGESCELIPAPAVSMFERLAMNPDVDVAKMERLIAMQERILQHQARSAFTRAFTRMQAELPEIDERGQIIVKGQLRSTYAKLEDIHKVITPILTRHGFAIRHRTEWPADKAGIIRIVGVLCHEDGHSEESAFEAQADTSEYRSAIQSMGSTVSYGRRYTTMDLLNIVTRGQDNDGQKEPKDFPAPAGFESWWNDLEALVANGLEALMQAWGASKPEYRNHVMATNPAGWRALKTKAEKGGRR